MERQIEIEIPQRLMEPLLFYAAEMGLSVEEIVEAAIKKYMKRSRDDAKR